MAQRTNRETKANGQEFVLSGGVISPEVLAALLAPPKRTMVTDDDIGRHDGSALLLPRDMDLETADRTIQAKIAEQSQEHRFVRRFDYRPEDGANATATVLTRMFGIVVGAKTGGNQGPFGPPPEPPTMLTVKTSHGTTRDVPWGSISIPELKGARLELGAGRGDRGAVFVVEVTAPKKHQARIEELFAAIEEELRVASIYRGHALEGADDLTFLDTSGFDPAKLVFSDLVEATLDAALWTLLRHPAWVQRQGMPLRRSVLLYGTWGSGKTSLGQKAAQLCEQHGWTFLLARAGKDNLPGVMRTASLYEPAVVFVEDIDRHIPTGDKDAMSEVLDIYDGFAAKGRRIVLVATTNRQDMIPPSVLRPGRTDYVIPIEGLDEPAAERIIRVNVPPESLADDIDFHQVYQHMRDFQPAWGKAVAERALSFALTRSAGGVVQRLTTADLVFAADSLHAQLEMMQAASDGPVSDSLDAAVERTVAKAMSGVEVYDTDYGPKSDTVYGLRVKE